MLQALDLLLPLVMKLQAEQLKKDGVEDPGVIEFGAVLIRLYQLVFLQLHQSEIRLLLLEQL